MLSSAGWVWVWLVCGVVHAEFVMLLWGQPVPADVVKAFELGVNGSFRR